MINNDFNNLIKDLNWLQQINVQAMSGVVQFFSTLEKMQKKESLYDYHIMDRQGNPHMVRGSQILAEENGDYVFGNYHFYYDASNDQITLQLATSAMVEISESDIKMNPYGYDSDFRVSGINSDYIFGDATLEKLLVGNSLDYVPLGTLHVHSGSAGAISVGVNNDDFIIENSASVGMTLASPSTDAGFIVFTDETAGSGKIAYDHTTDYMTFYTNLNIAFALLSNKNAHFYGSVGINTANPDGKLHVFTGSAGTVTAHVNADDVVVENSTNAGISIIAPNTAYSSIFFGDNDDNDVAGILYYHGNNTYYINAGASQILNMSTSSIVFNDDGLDMDIRFEANADANLLYLDSGNGRIGIKTGAPAVDFELYDGANNSRPIMRIMHKHDSQYGGYFQFFHSRVTNDYPNASDVIGTTQYRTYETGGTQTVAAYNDVQVVSVGAGIVEGKYRFVTQDSGGTIALRMSLGTGMQLGAPTGGDKGTGTLNVSSNIYKNNTAYTNPDFVLEHWATGKIEKYKNRERASLYVPMTIYEIEDYAKKNWRLPGITDEPAGVFDMTDIALELLERLYIVTIDQQHTIDGLESKLSELERRL